MIKNNVIALALQHPKPMVKLRELCCCVMLQSQPYLSVQSTNYNSRMENHWIKRKQSNSYVKCKNVRRRPLQILGHAHARETEGIQATGSCFFPL